MDHVVALPVTPTMSLLELAVPCEVFGYRRFGPDQDWYELRVCSEGGEPVVAGGFAPHHPYSFDELQRADTVVVAAGHAPDEAPHAGLVAAVRAAHRRGARIVSLCTGAFVLAEAGLLDGRSAATHWLHAAALARRYPAVHVRPDVLYVDDGDVLTSAGTLSAVDLCLHLVRTDHGAAVANALAKRMVTPAHREGGQSQYIQTALPAHTGDGLGPLLDWARERLDQPLTVGLLARRAGLNERTLVRRFHASTGLAPMRWLQARRIDRARELLEVGDTPVERVGERCGLGGPANFRRLFRDTVGVTPSAYRRSFRARGADGSPPPAVRAG
jgi:transcriptional regulator GlxA family with amidase domain